MENFIKDLGLDDLFLNIFKNKLNKRVFTLGVDGPTASGKTIFSKNIKTFLENNYNLNVHIFELDWSLKQRKKRVNDLENLSKNREKFKYEGELHMDLKKVVNFIKSVYSFNQEIDRNINKKKKILKLTKLYSRSDNGELTGEKVFILKPMDVIILEGHYTLNNSIDQYLDLNMLLLADNDTLLKRKIERVSNYRGENDTKHYFYKIDLPSFANHLKKFKSNSCLSINNNNYLKPKRMSIIDIDNWINSTGESSINYDSYEFFNSDKQFHYKLYSRSKFINKNIKICNKLFFKYLNILDKTMSSLVVNSITFQRKDLTSSINSTIKLLNLELKKNNIENIFTPIYSNSLYNVYFRTFPITLGLKLNTKAEQKYLIEFYEDRIEVMVFWEGDFVSLINKRILGDHDLNSKSEWEFRNLSSFNKEKLKNNDIILISPTDYILPPFLNRKLKIKSILSGKEQENLSVMECLKKLLKYESCWISRFALNQNLDFFSDICNNLGLKNIIIGNYIIVLSSTFVEINQDFRNFKHNWITNLRDHSRQVKDKLKYDIVIQNERKEIKRFVKKHCKFLKVFDTFLFLDKFVLESKSINILLKDIETILSSRNRLIRKRGIQFILKNFGMINLNSKKLWPKIQLLDKNISLNKLIDFSPSILAELYLWMTIKDTPSSVLAANIYDISEDSLDCKGILKSSINNKTPIVLQSSFNALGHKETSNNKIYGGYLKSKNGAADLVGVVKKSLIELVINKNAEIPLYGIGLDHVDFKNDIPSGRAKRFLDNAITTDNITHMVLDGSWLFDAKSKNFKDLKKSYNSIANYVGKLILNKPEYYIIDKEICAGELNYIENEKRANIPDVDEIVIFIDELKKMFRSNNSAHFLRRPSLFIGNLGTTHHGNDNEKPNTKFSEKWVATTKNDLFISPVLHGTTNSKNEVIKDASKGCKKINIAGNFLNIYIENLPPKLKEEINALDKNEPKKVLYKLRKSILDLDIETREIITQKIESYASFLTNLISSPKLSTNDIKYFKYNNFSFSKLEQKHILLELKNKLILNKTINKIKISKVVQFSPSLIEVAFGEFFKKTTQTFVDLGVKSFHIDVGDGRFISRKIDATEKVEYIKRNFTNLEIHCHLMTLNPHKKSYKNKSFVEYYAQIGCTHIAIHRRSISSIEDLDDCILKIKSLDVKPGIVLEVDEDFDEDLINLIYKHKIDWLIVMGVFIGYGGQVFQSKVMKKLQLINNYFMSNNYNCLLELDGGLTMENIKNCKIAGADIFSGWSIFKDNDQTNIKAQFNKIKKLLEN